MKIKADPNKYPESLHDSAVEQIGRKGRVCLASGKGGKGRTDCQADPGDFPPDNKKNKIYDAYTEQAKDNVSQQNLAVKNT